MSENQEINYMPPKRIAARMIGGTLVAASMAALGPVGTLVVGITANVLIYRAMAKDMEFDKASESKKTIQQEKT